MRVFGKLSFHILIVLCLAFFVQAAIKDSDQQEGDQEEHATTGGSTQDEEDVKVEISNEAVKPLSEAAIFFDYFMYQYNLIRSPSILKIEFEQKLDHFKAEETRTWIQIAYVDRHYEQADSPVLLCLGPFRPLKSEDLEEPTIQYLGNKLHATLYILEHRYYGKNNPTNLSIENLNNFFNTDQVLADIANFIKSSNDATKKWIIFGTGYGGSLTTWFRLEYPNVASSALVYGAPLLATPDEEMTYDLLHNFSETVIEVLQKAFNNIREAVTNAQYKELKNKFNMCSQLDEGNLDDNVNLMYWSMLNYLLSILLNDDTPTADILIDPSESTEIDRLAKVIKELNGKNCFFVNFNSAINLYKRIDINYESDTDLPNSLRTRLGTRSHIYDRCMKYGQFETTGNGSHTFGVIIDIHFYIKFCHRIFEKEDFDFDYFQMLLNKTNNKYGGQNIEIDNLIYITPDDPFWKSLGLVDSQKNKNVELISINYLDPDEDYMKNKLDLIIEKLNKWTRNTRTGDKNGEEMADGNL